MRSGARLALAVITLVVTATACGTPQDGGSRPHTTADCAPYARYGEHPGTEVTVYAENRDREADLFEETWADFAHCTGIDVQYEGDGEFEARIQVRVDGGNAPDVAFFPQPGLLERFARAGRLKPASAGVAALAQQGWSADWNSYATVDGTLYGTPLVANVKSLVWYSPKFFRARGLSVPRTWTELMAVTEKVAASGVKPWCAGIESAQATGWPVTDWIEDVLLRQQGTRVYDQWVAHEIPFDDPRVIKAMDTVGSILKNDRYANGGFGPARSMASISFQEAARRSSPATARCTARPRSTPTCGRRAPGSDRTRTSTPSSCRETTRPAIPYWAAGSSRRRSPTVPRSGRSRSTWPPRTSRTRG
ncbi:ABC transporter substrate-binding protein [Streptomyces diastatochromogenes]|nr:ABC transporter substrate-binding protein [Streptomyces diastatochromogenes]